jgi:hypothetical protein
MIDTRGELRRELTQALTVTGTCNILQGTGESDLRPTAPSIRRPHPQGGDGWDVHAGRFFLLLKGPERAYFESLNKQQPAK